MKFTKMHGCGNDYVYINGFTEKIENKPEWVQNVSDRHFGVGGDGAIFNIQLHTDTAPAVTTFQCAGCRRMLAVNPLRIPEEGGNFINLFKSVIR